MHLRSLTAALALTCAFTWAGQPVSAATSTKEMSNSEPKSAGAQPYDVQFLDSMSAHHQSAIEMARLAEHKTQHEELREFAKTVVEKQQKEKGKMKRWRQEWFQNQPSAVNRSLPGMKPMDMDALAKASGSKFDSMFIDMMTDHHRGAIAMSEDALNKVSHQEIKSLATRMIPEQQKEIEQLEVWKRAWSKERHG